MPGHEGVGVNMDFTFDGPLGPMPAGSGLNKPKVVEKSDPKKLELPLNNGAVSLAA